MALLSRNQLPESKVRIPEIVVIDSRIGCSDPLSDSFSIPGGVGTPWKLVNFYREVLCQKESGGVRWTPPLGDNNRIYLRPAKKLLENGPDMAVRIIVYGISVANNPPSLQWISGKADEVIQRRITS